MGYGGYLNPLPLRHKSIRVNLKLRVLKVTAAHEIAHQLGYAAEEEANFIAIDRSNAIR